MSRIIVLSDDFIHTLVERFHATPPAALPAEYQGLTAEDLGHILCYFRGRPRAQYPPTCTLSYTAEGLPHFTCTCLDGDTADATPSWRGLP
jgi:hypothetical protein